MPHGQSFTDRSQAGGENDSSEPTNGTFNSLVNFQLSQLQLRGPLTLSKAISNY